MPASFRLFSRAVHRPCAERPLLWQRSCNCAVVKCQKMAVLTCIFVCAFLSPERVLPVGIGGMIQRQVINFALKMTSLRNLGEIPGFNRERIK